MEIFWLVLVWLLLLYLIRLHREISFYKKIFNQNRDIYVPTLSEMIDNSSTGKQVLNIFLDLVRGAFSGFRYRSKNNEDDIPILMMPQPTEKELKF